MSVAIGEEYVLSGCAKMEVGLTDRASQSILRRHNIGFIPLSALDLRSGSMVASGSRRAAVSLYLPKPFKKHESKLV